MSSSIQTNVNSLVAQENLRVNSDFQSMTIQRLTSGYRINSSGDDAAGLAVANKFRSDTAELAQGVRNANDGISSLQIMDGAMNNVAKMLDRLRTLSVQSASATFKGNRNVLNTEFQSLLTEIDRQSQSIGLDTNGQFAKALSVFIGGGKTAAAGDLSTANGTVTMDLSSSAVDTRALGLKGMQVVAGTQDIGTGSTTHTVAQILAQGANTTAITGYSDLYFSGAGFSDSSKVKVSVNLAGVTDISTLTAAINNAIQTAGAGGTQAATAFKNAGVVASVNTDTAGGQQLAFTSSNAAFQVQAGDVMANALLGNLTGTTGTALATTVVGASNTVAGAFVPTDVTVQITGGGLSSPVNITFGAGVNTGDLAITSLLSQVAGSADLQAAGITATAGAAGAGKITFTSARGEKFNVAVSGDTANVLGFGTFLAGSGGVVDYTTLQAGADYANGTARGTTALEISLGGGASDGNAISIDLEAGNATAGTATGGATVDQNGKTYIFTKDGGAPLATITLGATDTTSLLAATAINAGAGVSAILTASVDSTGKLVITAVQKGAHSIVVTGTNTSGLGTITGASRTTADLKAALNGAFTADAELQKAGLEATTVGNRITIASNNGTYFRLNTANAGVATTTIGFGVAGATYTGAVVGNTAISVQDSQGATNTQAINFSALTYGSSDQAITVSANDSAGALQTKTITLQNDTTARVGRDIDETVNYINTQLQQSNNSTLQKIVAVKERNGTTEQINFLSSLASFSVGVGSSANAVGLNAGAASSEDSHLLGTGANASIGTQAGALLAVAAVATAVTTLGSAQAAVGKGMNQLNYAVGLAQSQISNFSAAESRIRDADVAAEAANLTKAQVLQQASIAAMAQANSAPQAVLALLRG